MDSQAELLT